MIQWVLMNKIKSTILLGSILVLSSCASPDLDTPEAWDAVGIKIGKKLFLRQCASNFNRPMEHSRESQESYCDCMWTKLKQVYTTPDEWINAPNGETAERLESINAQEECNLLRVDFDK